MRADLQYHFHNRLGDGFLAYRAAKTHTVYCLWLWFSDWMFKYHYAPRLWLRLNNWFFHRYFKPYIYKGAN